ncbi:M56 family metallopeptidase [Sulfitobacter sp. S190]|uniref:M56 family metallopeptidase n=1 Tax=Sulfitobacter sp. S190 TaxID=2867022 RepID=UPI0021A69C24|nr:M56 family metallopeptidase [Sulfitobacter sp. S190]UWR21600.1 M56 family metallopeptidase [Sulfitobacter sp. S190]
MIPGEALLNAFINANILIFVAYLLWLAVRFALNRGGLQHSHATQLKLLNTVFVAIILSPFLVLALGTLQSNGYAKSVNVNLSDMVVAYYLNGGFEMQATEFERLVNLRHTFMNNVINAAGWVALCAIAAFLVSMAIGTLRLCYSVICLFRIVSAGYTWRRIGRIHLRLSDRTLVPFSTRGLRNYYVVIPSHMLGQRQELAVSLAHEFQHLRQGDIEWEIILEALKPFFFFNPAYHAWKRQVENLRELSCDAEVLRRGRIDVRAYCDTLLSVCQQTLRKDRMFVVAVPKVTLVTADRSALRDGKMSFLQHRITALLDLRHLRRPRLLYAVTVMPMAAAIFLTAVAIQRPADWSQDRLMLSTVVNLERLDEINRLSTFGRIRN